MSVGRRVVVVGGGVIGAACAYYLSKAGWTVTVVDRGAFGAGCSHGNCGFVCPSHVLPLAVPGAVGSVFEGSVRRRGEEIIPSITGSAYVYAETTLFFDPQDPFRTGIRS